MLPPWPLLRRIDTSNGTAVGFKPSSSPPPPLLSLTPTPLPTSTSGQIVHNIFWGVSGIAIWVGFENVFAYLWATGRLAYESYVALCRPPFPTLPPPSPTHCVSLACLLC